MPAGKLHLKRTPAEQAEHEWRKAKRAAKKAAKKRRKPESSDGEPSSDVDAKRRRTSPKPSAEPSRDFALDSDSEYGPPPPPSGPSARAHKTDFEAIYAELEEQRFREKMWGAFEDDERLDATEARLNDYAHVPGRWRTMRAAEVMGDDPTTDPQMMDDEEYAEWIRAGMWRKKHGAEYEAQERKKAEREARRAREDAIRAETRLLERADEERRRKRRRSKERRREAEFRETYDTRWKQLLAAGEEEARRELRFKDIPWPVIGRSAVSEEDLTAETISAFLFHAVDDLAGTIDTSRARKEKLRETMLRFHPDKFEGRILSRVVDKDRERVREAVGSVVRIVNTLMASVK